MQERRAMTAWEKQGCEARLRKRVGWNSSSALFNHLLDNPLSGVLGDHPAPGSDLSFQAHPPRWQPFLPNTDSGNDVHQTLRSANISRMGASCDAVDLDSVWKGRRLIEPHIEELRPE